MCYLTSLAIPGKTNYCRWKSVMEIYINISSEEESEKMPENEKIKAGIPFSHNTEEIRALCAKGSFLKLKFGTL